MWLVNQNDNILLYYDIHCSLDENKQNKKFIRHKILPLIAVLEITLEVLNL